MFDEIDSVVTRQRQENTGEHPEQIFASLRQIISKFKRVIYQCGNCGRLFIDDIFHHSQVFSPDEVVADKKLLGSVKGSKWKRFVIGDWLSSREGKKGHLYWQGSGSRDDEESGYEFYDEWEKLEKRYYELIKGLSAKRILRNAHLKKDYEWLHTWRSEEKDFDFDFDGIG